MLNLIGSQYQSMKMDLRSREDLKFCPVSIYKPVLVCIGGLKGKQVIIPGPRRLDVGLLLLGGELASLALEGALRLEEAHHVLLLPLRPVVRNGGLGRHVDGVRFFRVVIHLRAVHLPQRISLQLECELLAFSH